MSEVIQETQPVEPPALPAGKQRRGGAGKIIMLTMLVLGTVGAFTFSKYKGISGGGGAARKGPPPVEAVPVVAAKAELKTVPIEVRAIGNVEAVSSVAIRALVSGELTKVHFEQGQDVKKGDLLFSIDPRPLQAALDQARAVYAKDSAQKAQLQAVLNKDMVTWRNAQAEAARYHQLFTQGLISVEQEQQYKVTAETAGATIEADKAAIQNSEAVLKADQAAIDNAVVQLSYATIRSPMDGKTGNLQVFAGNLVKANDTTPLVTINQISPVFVTFSLPEKELNRLKQFQSKGAITVTVTLPTDAGHKGSGELVFVDNQVDMTTGTIKLKAKLGNSERSLLPGQFVNVVMTLGDHTDAVVIPAAAIQLSQDGPYVYVVNPDQTVALRPVKVGSTLDTQAVIEKGVEPGEMVVTEGQLRLTPGAKIKF
ncbi:MAG: efflux RND transporter periplasmic adaptor subunit [Blastocatellia bacterium]|nr:efflux RND transporter periplasmic adaptor subunit [Blastocatellia bacterium]